MTVPTTSQSHESIAVRTAAAGAAGICMAFAGMQVALAAGAPLGEHVWGGSQPRVLPTRMRIASVGAAAILAGVATTVARRRLRTHRIRRLQPGETKRRCDKSGRSSSLS